jgi:NADPH-dependent 2,4-dienoyl-CoA reductase/sulfur reductase-like enzyme/nitrite reductase/ring-hydroxylating ferredoxin subunit
VLVAGNATRGAVDAPGARAHSRGMDSGETRLTGPDLAKGVAVADVPDGGSLLGHATGEAVLLARRGAQAFAVGATCTHYGGPLAEGLVVGEEVRCPWHHACFSLRTGEATGAPALKPVSCFDVETREGRFYVLGRREALTARPAGAGPSSVVIVGAGAAGNACAETLRAEGYGGPIAMIGAEGTGPVDRPNLSKDFLAGNAPPEWMPLRDKLFYRERQVELLVNTRVAAIDVARKVVTLEGGATRSYGALVLATGADPVKLPVTGADAPHVFVLRTLADADAIIARSAGAKSATVIGAGFIGLEVAASLRGRGLQVHVVAPEPIPLARVMGDAIGGFVRRLHEEHGVIFHLGDTVTAIDGKRATLKSGGVIEADVVVVGVGVRPRLALAEKAGLAIDRGVTVNARLETSVPGIYAAGDIARWPDVHSGENIRVEHWVVAERQGQTAARNMLGQREAFDAVPFFWSQHYDVPINYVGHAEKWDEIAIDGNIAAKDCLLKYKSKGRVLAVASIYRDLASLEAELAMEQGARS